MGTPLSILVLALTIPNHHTQQCSTLPELFNLSPWLLGKRLARDQAQAVYAALGLSPRCKGNIQYMELSCEGCQM